MNKEEFLEACKTGHLPTNVGLQIDVNSIEKEDGNTGLMIAAREGHLEIVRYMLDQYPEIDVNIRNKFGYNALMLGAQNGHLEILNQLLEHDKIDLEMTNKAGRKAEQCAKKKVKESVQSMINKTRLKRNGVLLNVVSPSPFDGMDSGNKRKILDNVHDGIPQKIVRPNQHLPNLPVTEEEPDVKLEVKMEEDADTDEKSTSELALARMKTGNHNVNHETNFVSPSPVRPNNPKESDSEKTIDLFSDQKLSDTESIRSSRDDNNSENIDVKPNVKDVLTARLENCLIDMGGAKENVTVAKEMFNLAKNLDLDDLKVICRRILLENLSMNTIFDLVDIFQELRGDKESEEMLNICINFMVANIDELRILPQWKPFLKQHPQLTIELIERL